MINIIEFLLNVSFTLMITFVLPNLYLRKEIKQILQASDSETYNRHFLGAGVLDQSINSSLKSSKFFHTPRFWLTISNERAIKLLKVNQIIENCYRVSWIVFCLLSVIGISILVVNKM